MATAAQHVTPLDALSRGVSACVDEVARLTLPDRIQWCDGSDAERRVIERNLVATRDLRR